MMLKRHPFMKKVLKRLGLIRTYLHTIKAIYDKSIANITPGENSKHTGYNSKQDRGFHLSLPLLIQYST